MINARISVWSALFPLVAVVAAAAAQPGPPCDDVPGAPSQGDDTRFVVRWEHRYNAALGSGNSMFEEGGPSEGSWSGNSVRDVPDSGGNWDYLGEMNTGGSALGGSLSGTIDGRFRIDADFPGESTVFDGAIYGVIVDVYVRGPAGTPYFVSTEAAGSVSASANGGGSFSSGYSMPGGSGGGPTSFATGPTLVTGTTSSTQLASDPEFTLATSRAFSLSGTANRSFCIFCGGARFWEVIANASFNVDAGPLPFTLKCDGTLRVPTNLSGPANTDAFSEIPNKPGFATGGQRFEIEADFTGEDCTCCEYRQFLRLTDATVDVLVQPGNAPLRAALANDWTNSDGDRFNPGCYIEDGLTPSASCPRGAVYGDRVEEADTGCKGRGEGYGANPCTFRAVDVPSVSSGAPLSGGFAANHLGIRYQLDFEGQIVHLGSTRCTGLAQPREDLVLKRTRWSICFEIDQNNNVTSCSTRESRREPRTTDDAARVEVPFLSGDASVTARRLDDGTLVLNIAQSRLASAPALNASAMQATSPAFSLDAIYDTEVLAVNSLGGAGVTFIQTLIASDADACLGLVDLDITINGETIPVTLDLAPISNCSSCPADLTGPAQDGIPDNAVDASDLNFFLNEYVAQFGTPGGTGPNNFTADLTGPAQDGNPDGTVDASDLNFFLNEYVAGFGPCP
jgi:hypothetical protein